MEKCSFLSPIYKENFLKSVFGKIALISLLGFNIAK